MVYDTFKIEQWNPEALRHVVGNFQPTNPSVCGGEHSIQGRHEQPVGQLVGATLDAQSEDRCFPDSKSIRNKSPAARNLFDSLYGNFAIVCLQETR